MAAAKAVELRGRGHWWSSSSSSPAATDQPEAMKFYFMEMNDPPCRWSTP